MAWGGEDVERWRQLGHALVNVRCENKRWRLIAADAMATMELHGEEIVCQRLGIDFDSIVAPPAELAGDDTVQG